MTIRQGTSIIEIIIAAALISMAMIAALSLMNRSQKQNIYARNLAEATKYTTQASEWIRAEKASLGWATIAHKVESAGSGSIYCLNNLPDPSNPGYTDFTSLAVGQCGNNEYIAGTVFKREMTAAISPDNPGLIKIIISVTWLENTSRQATIEMELGEW